MTPSQTADQMGLTLTKLVNAATKLEEALDAEKNAFLTRDAEAIQTLAAAKQLLIEEIESHTAEQNTLLGNAGLSLDRQGMEAFIAKQEQKKRPALSKIFNKLHQLLESCSRKNQVNGNMIAAGRQATETALSILRGGINTGEPLYGAEGETVQSSQAQTIAKA